ncbi:MAG TPA: dimethylargininase [Rhodanobacteraceae bacterium]|nr:dimethylargininase [Rhodanobacteraceae bacterium]
MPIAITRDVSTSLGACELSFVDRVSIDVERAAAQHTAYRRALVALGCDVSELGAENALPDAVFVEDIAIVLDELAIVTRPGAASRRAEVASVANAVARHRSLKTIAAPGTMDGGDVLVIGRTIFVGESARTNRDGIAQLAAFVRDAGYLVHPVPIHGCLHLKSAVTEVADGVVLIEPRWVDRAAFAAFRQIEADPDEPHAANVLRIGDGAIYPASFPRTLRRLEDAGITPTLVDVSELQKAEGAVTCCSLVFSGMLT